MRGLVWCVLGFVEVWVITLKSMTLGGRVTASDRGQSSPLEVFRPDLCAATLIVVTFLR